MNKKVFLILPLLASVAAFADMDGITGGNEGNYGNLIPQPKFVVCTDRTFTDCRDLTAAEIKKLDADKFSTASYAGGEGN